MKVLITGAGGFLGRYIAEFLIADGHEVNNFSRRPHPELSVLGIPTILGDLKNSNEVLAAIKGHHAVIHTASMVSMWGRYPDFHQTNVVGTQNIIDACRRYNIEKLVYTSTPSVVFKRDDLCHVNENCPYNQNFLSFYAQTKMMAEKLVLQANSNRLATIALRPHLIFGPRDPHILPKLVERAQRGQLKRIGDGKNLVDVTYVENAAHAHLQALYRMSIQNPICGKAYFLGQEKPVPLWKFIDELIAIKKLPPIKSGLSFSSAFFLGGVLEKTYRLFSIYKKEPPMTRFIALSLAKSHYFDQQNARNAFAYHPSINMHEALRKTAQNQVTSSSSC